MSTEACGGGDSSRLAQLMRLAEANPKNILALYGIAMEYRSMGRREECIGALRRVLEVDPAHVATHQQLGTALAETGRIDEARSVLRQGIEHAMRLGNMKAHGEMSEVLARLP